MPTILITQKQYALNNNYYSVLAAGIIAFRFGIR